MSFDEGSLAHLSTGFTIKESMHQLMLQERKMRVTNGMTQPSSSSNESPLCWGFGSGHTTTVSVTSKKWETRQR